MTSETPKKSNVIEMKRDKKTKPKKETDVKIPTILMMSIKMSGAMWRRAKRTLRKLGKAELPPRSR